LVGLLAFKQTHSNQVRFGWLLGWLGRSESCFMGLLFEWLEAPLIAWLVGRSGAQGLTVVAIAVLQAGQQSSGYGWNNNLLVGWLVGWLAGHGVTMEIRSATSTSGCQHDGGQAHASFLLRTSCVAFAGAALCFVASVVAWLVSWLVRSEGWLVGWMVSWLVGRLVGW
jgi:hypothetical protein